MATPKEMIDCLSSVMGVPSATVSVHDRNLQEAGLRARQKRGRALVAVSTSDAANLIVAVAASRTSKGSAQAVMDNKNVASELRADLDAELENPGSSEKSGKSYLVTIHACADLSVFAEFGFPTVAAAANLLRRNSSSAAA